MLAIGTYWTGSARRRAFIDEVTRWSKQLKLELEGNRTLVIAEVKDAETAINQIGLRREHRTRVVLFAPASSKEGRLGVPKAIGR